MRASLPFLIVLMAAAAGCAGAGGPGAAEGTGGSVEAGSGEPASTQSASTDEGRPEGLPQEREGQYDRPRAAETRTDARSSGGAYVPAGFGEGSLWATDILACNDTGGAPPPGEYDDGSVAMAACAAPSSMSLKRLDPESGEEQAAVELEGFFANVTEVAFGAGSVWVSSADQHFGPVDPAGSGGDAVLRVDPGTNRAVGRVPVAYPSGVAFGHGSAWATSDVRGTLTRIDPETNRVVAQIEVGRGAVDVVVDERRGGDVWVAGLHLSDDYGGSPPPERSGARKLTRIDPETNRVVAEVQVDVGSPDGGAQSVAVGEGSVWAQSGGGDLLKVDPEANRVVARVPLGDYPGHLAVSGGYVWATGQDGPPDAGDWLKRVDPRTLEVVGSRELGSAGSGGYGRLAADARGNVWFVEGGAREGTGTLARISP